MVQNARTIDTKIAPMTIFLVLFPTIDSTSNASRLCKLVSCIAAAKIMLQLQVLRLRLKTTESVTKRVIRS